MIHLKKSDTSEEEKKIVKSAYENIIKTTYDISTKEGARIAVEAGVPYHQISIARSENKVSIPFFHPDEDDGNSVALDNYGQFFSMLAEGMTLPERVSRKLKEDYPKAYEIFSEAGKLPN